MSHSGSFSQSCAGRHLLIDLHGGSSRLDDLDYIQAACEDAARATGATILDCRFHHFGEGFGVSGVVILAESHLSVHSWPERGFAAFDVFVCGDCDPNLAVPVLRERFAPSRVEVTHHLRGGTWDDQCLV